MRLRRIGTHRLNRLTPTAPLLATLLLSPPIFPQAADTVDEAADTAQPTEAPPDETNEEAESDQPEAPPTNAEAHSAVLEQLKAQLDQLKAQVQQEIQGLDDLVLDQLFDDEKVPAAEQAVEDEPIDRPAPAEPAPDVESLIEAEKQRAQAEALIAQLADAEESELAGIEQALAELGKSSLVPLKLAALSDDFAVRTRAGAMARRLRWRLVCTPAMLEKHPGLTETLAGEATKPRREMIEALIAEPQADYLPVFVECLADRDSYI
ncbi:MAG: hypothetical protein KTR15_02550, partial [Phycisphaeraceae bacterium]|nr:hypothetical protein [Phycisphaeraceae bacterium]